MVSSASSNSTLVTEGIVTVRLWEASNESAIAAPPTTRVNKKANRSTLIRFTTKTSLIVLVKIFEQKGFKTQPLIPDSKKPTLHY
jgi:hypothetical protein